MSIDISKPISKVTYSGVEIPLYASAHEDTLARSIVNGTITEYIDSKISSIRAYAFSGCSSLSRVSCENCRTISNGAFYSCVSLSDLSLPNCGDIEGDAFTNCSSLSNIYLPNTYSVNGQSPLQRIGVINAKFDILASIRLSCFNNCSSLKTVEIPAVYDIPDGFYKCFSLEKLIMKCTRRLQCSFSSCTMLSELRIYGTYASSISYVSLSYSNTFLNTPMVDSTYLGYYGSIYVPSYVLSVYQTLPSTWSLTGVSSERFVGVPDEELGIVCPYRYYQSTLSQIPMFELSASIIGGNAFYSCSNLVSNLEFPNVICIESSAFYRDRTLFSINLPNCKYIGDGAFTHGYLKNINIPNCKYLGKDAFAYCSLTSFSAPDLQYIAANAFAFNTTLSQLVINNSTCTLYSTDAFVGTPMSRTDLGYFGSIYVPSEYVSAYKTSTNWVQYSDRITSIENLPEEV